MISDTDARFRNCLGRFFRGNAQKYLKSGVGVLFYWGSIKRSLTRELSFIQKMPAFCEAGIAFFTENLQQFGR
jgi:hypothetical protein